MISTTRSKEGGRGGAWNRPKLHEEENSYLKKKGKKRKGTSDFTKKRGKRGPSKLVSSGSRGYGSRDKEILAQGVGARLERVWTNQGLVNKSKRENLAAGIAAEAVTGDQTR